MKRPLNIHTVEFEKSGFWVDDNNNQIDKVGPVAYRVTYVAKWWVTPAALIAELRKTFKPYEEITLPKDSPIYGGATKHYSFYKLTHISVKQNKKVLWDYVLKDMESNGGWCEHYSDQEMKS